MPSPKPSCFAGRRETPALLPILASELVGFGAHEPTCSTGLTIRGRSLSPRLVAGGLEALRSSRELTDRDELSGYVGPRSRCSGSMLRSSARRGSACPGANRRRCRIATT